MRVAFLPATLALVAATAAAAAVTPGPTFTDRAGDAAGAPDISVVSASQPLDRVAIAIRARDAASWKNAAATLDIDADGDPGTGDAGGTTGIEFSYVLHADHSQFTLDLPGGASTTPKATARLAGATLTIVIPQTELHAYHPIGFAVSTTAPSGRSDRAPNTGEWRFDPDAKLVAVTATFTPAAPKQGRVFALRSVRTRFADGATGTGPVTCGARIGLANLTGSCRWRIPPRTKGRRLTVVVGAGGPVWEGGVSRTYDFIVR